MSYQDNVRAAAAALKAGEESNWELARLTSENTWDGSGPLGLKQHGKVSMEQWCTDVRTASGRRFAVGTGRKYKAIWRRHGSLSPGERELTWYEAYESVQGSNETRDERFARVNLSQGIEYGTPEAKREAFARLSQDRDVVSDEATSQQVFQQIVEHNPVAVEQAVTDRSVNARVQSAQYKALDQTLRPQREAQAESKATLETDDSTLEHTHFLYGVQSRVEQWAHELHEVEAFLQRVDDVNVMTRRSTRRSLELLIDAATRCRDALPHSYDEPDTEPQAAVRAAQAAIKGSKR